MTLTRLDRYKAISYGFVSPFEFDVYNSILELLLFGKKVNPMPLARFTHFKAISDGFDSPFGRTARS